MKKGRALTRDDHRRLGVEYFNGTWTLLGKKGRTPLETNRMIHMTHASAFHWLHAGTPLNHARSEWQASRVYCVAKMPAPALYHAKLCLDLCQRHGIGDFDLAYAYEAMARSSAAAGRRADAAKWLRKAAAAGRRIREKDDRDYFFQTDLATVSGYRASMARG